MKNKNNQSTTQFSKRIDLIQFLYFHFLMGFPLEKTKDFFIKKRNFDLYQKQIMLFFFDHHEKMIALIKEKLDKKWTFQSIANLDKAILLICISEHYTHDLSKKIIISEAVKISKKFSDETNYRYINKILDDIFLNVKKTHFIIDQKIT